MFTVTRSEFNPIISPVKEHPWEAAATFNGCPVIQGKKISMLYRAMSEPDPLNEHHLAMSVIARATSTDGIRYDNRQVLICPDTDFDSHGCEDPRVTKIGSTYYIFYTALGGFPFSADNIKVAVALSKDLKTIKEKHLVTPFNAKAMALFPEKINGKMAALLTINTDRKPSDICFAEFDPPEEMWSEPYWKKWQENVDAHKLNIRRLPDDHLELGAPPVKTDRGWLVLYCHMQRYGRSDQVFGFEVLLLDLKNPRHIIGRTKGPFMVPEMFYEKVGHVSHTIFPSGALIRDKKLEVYYGATDTYCAVATIPVDNLLSSIADDEKKIMIRFPGNPILTPRPGVLWESAGTINPAAIDIGNKTCIFYRAVSNGNISTLGYAESTDGFSIDFRGEKPAYFPRVDFENKKDGGDNYGCEDPRLIKIGDKIFMTYTGYDGTTPRVAVTSIGVKDFSNRKWSAWTRPEAITPPGVTDKDAVILPEPVNGKYMVIHRINEVICADFVKSLDFSKERINQCIEMIAPRRGMWDGGKVGISTPPVKTKAGWLVLYHGVSWSTTYRVGAVLLDLNDPTVVLARTAVPLFEPEEDYERKGITKDVVFPCGLTVRKGIAYVYYGAADYSTGVATIKMSHLLRVLER
ncbi:MAG: hypothetical protein NT077_02375 [Candidatus Taylorbacteria bacterium]|nr:hypothetical protein [Candidatus Taylorbacteria bacterium]